MPKKKPHPLEPDILITRYSWEWLKTLPFGESRVTKGPPHSARQYASRHGFGLKVERMFFSRSKITKVKLKRK